MWAVPLADTKCVLESAPKKPGKVWPAVCLYSWIFSCFVPLNVNYPLVILVGVLGSLLSVFGDLCASIMKRHAEIKDFGNLIPGHGGILDRFDSMLFLSPFLCLVLGLGGIVALA